MAAISARKRRKRHAEAAAWVLENRDTQRRAERARNFAAWLDGDPDNRAIYEAAEKLMGDARTAILSEPALRDLQVKPRASATKRASVAIVGIAVAGSVFALADGPMRLRADAMSGPREMPVVTLADGSTMQLNAGSAVAYEFSQNTRKVTLLRGEAFFQVAKDARRPFVVEAQGARTTALGTAFDVRLGKEATHVAVTEHAVAVAPLAGPGTAVRLMQSQQAAYGRDGRLKDIRPADPDAVLAWRRGMLVVDNAALTDVVAEIERHFSGRIVIVNSQLAARRVSGTFTVIDVDAGLALLRESLGLTVIKMGPLIILS